MSHYMHCHASQERRWNDAGTASAADTEVGTLVTVTITAPVLGFQLHHGQGGRHGALLAGITAGSEASGAGLCVRMALLRINDTDVPCAPFEGIIGVLTCAERPLNLSRD